MERQMDNLDREEAGLQRADQKITGVSGPAGAAVDQRRLTRRAASID